MEGGIVGSRISTALKFTLLAGAIVYLLFYLFIAVSRMRYPFELEWLEGIMVDHVRRVLANEKLYVSPTIEFVPFLYTPLYYYVSAAASAIFGVGFLPLRVVSFVASLGCFAIIFLMVRRETASAFAGALAVGLFAATYRLTGAWLDVARVDSLSLFLLLTAVYVARRSDSAQAYLLAGTVISLSFFTKQTALVQFSPVILYCLYADWRRGLMLVATIVTLVGGGTLILDYVHDGWYNFYTFRLPRSFGIEISKALEYWTRDLLPVSLAGALALLYLFIEVLREDRARWMFYALFAAGMVGGAWGVRSHDGGYNNDLLPAFAAIAILFGLGTHALLDQARQIGAEKRWVLQSYVFVICILQFSVLAYGVRSQIPHRSATEQGRRFVQALSRIEGDVYTPYYGYLPTLAGKKSYAHLAPVSDIFRSDEEEVKRRLAEEMSQAFRNHRFSAVLLDSARLGWLGVDGRDGWAEFTDVDKYYVKGPVAPSSRIELPRMATGMQLTPQIVHRPRGARLTLERNH